MKIKDKREREKQKQKKKRGYANYSEGIDESYISLLWV